MVGRLAGSVRLWQAAFQARQHMLSGCCTIAPPRCLLARQLVRAAASGAMQSKLRTMKMPLVASMILICRGHPGGRE